MVQVLANVSRTTVNANEKHLAFARLRHYFHTHYAPHIPTVLANGAVEGAKEVNAIFLMHWLVKDKAVEFVDPAARTPTSTIVSTIYSIGEIEEFVQVLNECLREDMRICHTDVFALAIAWMFQTTVEEARREE
jgi:hypothetical protein